jgi:fimbrial chaperone protein
MIARSLGLLLLGAGLTLAVPASGARAGQIRVSTVRIDLSDRQPAATITITNDGAQKSLVQIRAMSWTQADGKDVQDVTSDLIVTPPIADIDPAGRQMIRVGFVGKKQMPVEGTFRLQIEEVPRQDQEQTHSVETYLRISVPIFIAAATPKAAPVLTARLANEEKGELRLYNSGPLHERLVSYQISLGGKLVGEPHKGLFYVLPGKYVGLPLTAAERAVQGGSVEILGDEGKITIPLSPAE